MGICGRGYQRRRGVLLLAVAAGLIVSIGAQDITTSHSDDHDDHDHDEHSASDTTSHSTHDHHDHGEHTTSSESSHAGHDHGSHGGGLFEASAIYDVEAGNNSFIAFPAEGSFDLDSFTFMIVPADSADDEGLEGAEEDAEEAWEAYVDGAEATSLSSGESASPAANVVYNIDLENPLVLVPVEVEAAGAYAFFFEHGSGEVGTALVSPSGTVIAAVAGEVAEEEEEEEEGDEIEDASASHWIQGVLSCVVVSLCSLTGIILIISKKVSYSINLGYAYLFAAGALLAAALLHILPEGMESLEEKYDSLHDLGLYSGLIILGGLSFGILIHALLETGTEHDHSAMIVMGPAQAGALEAQNGASDKVAHSTNTTQPVSPHEGSSMESLRDLIDSKAGKPLTDFSGIQPVCWNVIIGDSVHNFADGVTIGAAFLSCGTTTGWVIAASTIIHEVPHELADFMALLKGGMSVKQALVYNFLSALSCILGVIIILALGDTLSNFDVGVILLLGAGSFMFIALPYLVPDGLAVSKAVVEQGRSAVLRTQLIKLLFFVLGALIIGVPLMFHEHCHAGHDHEGHDH